MVPDNLSEVSLQAIVGVSGWQSKYRLITQWGKLVESKPEMRISENFISGCETPAWLAAEKDESGKYHYFFDSDSKVINGLAALLLSCIDGKTKEEIDAIDTNDLMRSAGLEKHLTPSRNNGFKSILLRARTLAEISDD